MKAPFPWFGGKSRVASQVWQRFGDVPNYVEPFAGSLAVLLDRPTAPGIETVNDLDGLISNFWRSIALSPDETALWADWPVSECDLHARHLWLLGELPTLADRLCANADWHSPKIAGWWVWGIAQMPMGGWCGGKGTWAPVDGVLSRTVGGGGISRTLPHMGKGQGVHGASNIFGWFANLHKRLRRVRVCQGDWKRVMIDTVTQQHGLTGIFLDPPYLSAESAGKLYRTDSATVAIDVRNWAIANGNNPMFRIALCGWSGEHDLPGWTKVAWKSHGGWAARRKGGGENHQLERIWFSPHCLSEKQGSLF